MNAGWIPIGKYSSYYLLLARCRVSARPGVSSLGYVTSFNSTRGSVEAIIANWTEENLGKISFKITGVSGIQTRTVFPILSEVSGHWTTGTEYQQFMITHSEEILREPTKKLWNMPFCVIISFKFRTWTRVINSCQIRTSTIHKRIKELYENLRSWGKVQNHIYIFPHGPRISGEMPSIKPFSVVLLKTMTQN